MSDNPIQGLMTTAMENLQGMIEANTIIGDPIETPDGSTIIPISKVGFGFAAGGSELAGQQGQQGGDSQDSLPFCGGSGGGVSVQPVAFLVLTKDGIKMVHLNEHTHIYEKMIDKAPETLEKLQKVLKESFGSSQQQSSDSSSGGGSGDSGGSNNGGSRQERRKERKDSNYDI